MADENGLGSTIMGFLQSPLGGGLAAGGVSLLGNLLAGGKYDDAAAKQAAAQERALALQNQIYQETKAQADPYLKAGQRGLKGYEGKIAGYTQPTYDYKQEDFDKSKFKSEGYDWLMDQAMKTNNAAMASRGMVLGSGAAKSLQDRAAGLASQEMQASYDRWLKDSMLRQQQADNAYNRNINFQNQDVQNWGALSKTGQDALNTVAGAGSNYALGGAKTLGELGDAQASSDVAQGKNWVNTTGAISSALSKYFEDEASKSATQKSKSSAGV